MRVLDLFSGIGGFSLGLERAGMTTVAFCEIEEYPRRVLAKHWPDVPIHTDIRELDGTQYRGTVDVVCGGFPCQDISNAGNGAGLKGERSGMWREFARIVGEVRPRFTIVENVSALLSRGLGEVLGDLAALGFDSEWHCIPACAVGSAQRRDRVWIIANANGRGQQGCQERYSEGPYIERWAYVDGLAMGQRRARDAASRECRVAHGIPKRVDRVKALGNAVVPQVVEQIGRAIMQ